LTTSTTFGISIKTGRASSKERPLRSTIKEPGADSKESGNPASTSKMRNSRYSVGLTAEVRTYTLWLFATPGAGGGNSIEEVGTFPSESLFEPPSAWIFVGKSVKSARTMKKPKRERIQKTVPCRDRATTSKRVRQELVGGRFLKWRTADRKLREGSIIP